MAGDMEEKWQKSITCIKEGVNYLWNTKEFSDAVIIVRGHPVKVHKLILAARSSEFAKLLLTPNASNEIIVDRKSSVTKEGVEALLHFLYKDQLITKDKKSVVEAYLAAKYFKQNLLQATCIKEIELWILNADEVCDLLAIGSEIPQIKDKCTSFINQNGEAVISSDSFKNASFTCMDIILKSGALDGIPPLQRVKDIIHWGACQETAKPVNYSVVREKLTNDLLGKLGFEHLSLHELAVITKEYPGVLTHEENSQFLAYQYSKDKTDLPKWCCPSI